MARFGLRFTAFGFLLLFGGVRAVQSVGPDRPSHRMESSRQAFSQLLLEPGLGMSIGLSLFTGIGATLISVIGTAMLFAAYASGRSRWLERLSRPILALPHAAFAFGLLLFLTPGGLAIRLIHGATGLFPEPPAIASVNDPLGLALILALVCKEIPFLVLVGLPALARLMAGGHLTAARALGAQQASGFLVVLWPRLYREIRLPVLAVLAYGTSTVDMAQIIGPTTPPTFAVAVTRLMSGAGAEGYAKGEAGAVLLIGVTLLAIILWLMLERAAGAALRYFIRQGRRGGRIEPALRLGGGTGLLLLGFSLAAVLGSLCLSAFSGRWLYPAAFPDTLSLEGWRQAALYGHVLSDTLIIAAVSAAVAFLMVLLLLEARRPEERAGSVAMLVSAVMFAPLLLPQLSLVSGISALCLWWASAMGWWR